MTQPQVHQHSPTLIRRHATPGSGSSNQINQASIGQGFSQNSALQNRFNILIENTPTEFTQQIIACAINLVAKEFALLVEQSVISPIREHVVIQDWINNPKRLLTLEILDNQSVIVDTIKFHDCDIVDHVVDFNYANATPVVHVLGIKYDKIDLGSVNAQSAYASAMSIVGKP